MLNVHGLPGRRPHRSEGGYALLAVMAAAAIALIMLARALPQEAMRAQRLREERLIMRGEQYTRAIELYFREHKKYPEELDDLEDTNGVRYLRRRYQDPITGEDEWRLIHMGTDGRFKDSLIYDTEEEDEYQMTDGGFGQRQTPEQRRRSAAMASASTGAYYNPTGFDGAERARQQRDSAAPDPLGAQQGAYGPNVATLTDPNLQQPQVGPDGQPLPPDQPTDYSQVPPGQVPLDAGQRPQGQQPGAFPGATYQQQPQQQQDPRGGAFRFQNQRGSTAAGGFGARPQGQPAQPPPGGIGQQGVAPQAANMIQRLLTTPRPGGLAGLRGQTAAAAGQGAQAFQEGVAGVASKAEERGVKVYKGYENYNEWEFVYDYRKDQAMGGMGAGGAPMGDGLEAGQPGLTPSGMMGTPPAGVGVGGFIASPQGVPAQPAQPSAPTRGRRDPRQTRPSLPSTNPNLPPSTFGTRPSTASPTPPGVPGQPTQPGGPLFPGVNPNQPQQPPPPPPAQPQQPGGAFRLRNQRQQQ